MCVRNILKKLGQTVSLTHWGIGLLEMLIVTQPVNKFPVYLEPISSLLCSQEPPTDTNPGLQEFIIRREATQFRTVYIVFIVRQMTGYLMFKFAFSIQIGSCNWNIFNLYSLLFPHFIFKKKNHALHWSRSK